MRSLSSLTIHTGHRDLVGAAGYARSTPADPDAMRRVFETGLRRAKCKARLAEDAGE
jgi:hypothetical protein